MGDEPGFAKFVEGFRECGGAHAAKSAELLDGSGNIEADQRVEHPLGSRRFIGFGGRRRTEHLECDRRSVLVEFEQDILRSSGGAVFDGEDEVLAVSPEV
jgi:hypothetical protein